MIMMIMMMMMKKKKTKKRKKKEEEEEEGEEEEEEKKKRRRRGRGSQPSYTYTNAFRDLTNPGSLCACLKPVLLMLVPYPRVCPHGYRP